MTLPSELPLSSAVSVTSEPDTAPMARAKGCAYAGGPDVILVLNHHHLILCDMEATAHAVI